MATSLDMAMGGSFNPPAQTSDPAEHASAAASPNDHTFGHNAVTITLALLGMYALIFGLNIVERVVKG